MAVTSDEARALGEHGVRAARGRAEVDALVDSTVPAVSQIVEWVPEAYRQAYLDGAASVLGYEPLVET